MNQAHNHQWLQCAWDDSAFISAPCVSPLVHRKRFFPHLLILFSPLFCRRCNRKWRTWRGWEEPLSLCMNLDKTFKARHRTVIHQIVIPCHLLSPFLALHKGQSSHFWAITSNTGWLTWKVSSGLFNPSHCELRWKYLLPKIRPSA